MYTIFIGRKDFFRFFLVFTQPYLNVESTWVKRGKSNLGERSTTPISKILNLMDPQIINVSIMMYCYSTREYLLIKSYIEILKLLHFVFMKFKYYSEVNKNKYEFNTIVYF